MKKPICLLAMLCAALPLGAQPDPRPMPEPDAAEIREKARAAAEMAREDAREAMERAREEVRAKVAEFRDHDFSFAAKPAIDMALKLQTELAVSPQMKYSMGRHDSEDRLYDRGQRAMDERRWDEALENFSQAAAKGGTRADGALYWKAYSLGKLGRREEGLAAIAELRKAYGSSRWLDDAKALEIELRQASGQKVSPEQESDEDLKLMALNGIMQSDPERALPLLENLLKTSSSPKLKVRALYVLAQSDAPRARQILEQVARGSAGNPDMQLKAISYLTVRRKGMANAQLPWEIYSSTNDPAVKRALIQSFIAGQDKEHLLQIAKSEKTSALRQEAVGALGATGAYAELAQMYSSESAPEIRQRILESLSGSRNGTFLLDIAKAEKDPKLKRTAIHMLGGMKTTGDALVTLYGGEQDAQVRRAILDSLSGQRNAKQLVDLARKESDPQMKREIVSRLSGMKSKEASDYLLELLK